MQKDPVKSYVLARLREPITYVGLVLMYAQVTAFVHLHTGNLAGAAAAISAFMSVFLPEKRK